MAYVLQDPDENLVWSYDWTDWLDGDTIASASASIDPAGSPAPTVTSMSPSTTSSSAQVSGLTQGVKYNLTLRITTTTGGETGERSFAIICGRR